MLRKILPPIVLAISLIALGLSLAYSDVSYNSAAGVGSIGQRFSNGVVTNSGIKPTSSGLCLITGASGLTESFGACGGGGGSGTVTSVAVTGASGVSVVSGSPITTSGTIALGLSAIPNTALANSSMTLAGHSVALGGTQTFACADLSNGATGCSTATGTSGATLPLMNGTNTWSGAQTFTNASGIMATSGGEFGVQGSNPDDAMFEVYSANSGDMTAHFHNNGLQGTTGGGKVSINSTPTGTPAAIVSGNRLGSLQFGGTFDNTLALKDGPSINSFATQTWSSSVAGSKLVFNTVPNGALTRTTAMTLDQDQSATFAGAISSQTETFNGLLSWPYDGDQQFMGNADASKFRVGGYAAASGGLATLLGGGDFAHYYFSHNFSQNASGVISSPDDATSTSYVMLWSDAGLENAYQAPVSSVVVLNSTPTFSRDLLHGNMTMSGNLTIGGGANYSTNVNITAGTNAQGQAPLTADVNVITTCSANPCGVTLPTATVGRHILIINKGGNPVNIFPASGAYVDAAAQNASSFQLSPSSYSTSYQAEFSAYSTTQWNSSYRGATLYSTVTGVLTGGAASSVPYQTAAGATSFFAGLANAVVAYSAVGTPSASVTLPTNLSIANPSSGLAASAVGYLGIPQNIVSGVAYTTVIGDAGHEIYHPAADNVARALTIDSNANVPYPIGTCITFTNMAATSATIPITSDTMYLSGAGTTGTRTLAQYGTATACKKTSTTWLIGGINLTFNDVDIGWSIDAGNDANYDKRARA